MIVVFGRPGFETFFVDCDSLKATLVFDNIFIVAVILYCYAAQRYGPLADNSSNVPTG